MPPIVLFLRHGYRLDWDEPEAPTPTGLPHDPSLSCMGVQQAEDSARYLRDHVRSRILPPIRRVYSSPFYRTLETAASVARELGVKITIENGLSWFVAGSYFCRAELPRNAVIPLPCTPRTPLKISEFFGNSSKSVQPYPAPREMLHKMFPLVDTSYRSVMNGPENPLEETKAAFHKRLKKTMRRLLEQHSLREDADCETVICVTHAAGVIAATRGLIGDSNACVRCPSAGLVKLAYDQRKGRYDIEENGTTKHLSTGELRNWSFPDEESNIPTDAVIP